METLAIRFRISSNTELIGPEFHLRTSQLKAIGADYDGGGQSWYLWLDQSGVPRLNSLFELARVFGTTITADKVGR